MHKLHYRTNKVVKWLLACETFSALLFALMFDYTADNVLRSCDLNSIEHM